MSHTTNRILTELHCEEDDAPEWGICELLACEVLCTPPAPTVALLFVLLPAATDGAADVEVILELLFWLSPASLPQVPC